MINISIIMPLYNAEKYLNEALQSVLKQTYTDFELICVDDASADTTMEILRNFQKKDNRIRIISNNERMGAATSRNKGIKVAQGEYITFLDGDDIFEEEMLEIAYKTARKNDADIVIYEYKHVLSENIYNKLIYERSSQFVNKYCQKPFKVSDYSPLDFLHWTGTPCNKLYRRDFIVLNQLEFQTLSCSNDVFFVEMALFLAEKIIVLDDRRVMVYARDHFEVSRISYDRDPMCAYLAIEKIGKELTARKIFSEFAEYYYWLVYIVLNGALILTKTEENRVRFYEFLMKEGIRNLFDINRECFEKTDRYIMNLLVQYEKQEYETQWYKKVTLFSYYLEKKEHEVRNLFQAFIENNVHTVLWGVGIKGKALLEFLAIYNLNVSSVVDKDEQKWGSQVCGYMVKSPEQIWDETQVIIVTSHAIYSELLPITEKKKIQLVNIEAIVGKD